jgi:D-glycero-beta-D-manno-heptose-7-phosphate kinase
MLLLKVMIANARQIEAQVTRLAKEWSKTEGRRVLVVGDVGLDQYVMGGVRRISPEAPVPVLEVDTEDARAGLAANVAQNLAALGARPRLLGLVGDDPAAAELFNLLRQGGVDDIQWVLDSERPTTRKLRAMSGQHHLVRVDFEKRHHMSPPVEKEFLARYEAALLEADVVVLQDYGKGIFSESFCQSAIRKAQSLGKKVLVDPHRTTPVRSYRGANVLKPNKDEAYALAALPIDELRAGPEGFRAVVEDLREKTKCETLLVTMGKDGVLVYEKEPITVPTVSRQVFDVTGAGDTFLAAFAMAYATGFGTELAALAGNAASGVVVGKVGSVPCRRDELLTALETYTQGL